MPYRTILALIAIAALSLAGCATAEEMQQYDQTRCLGYGFQQGTADFAACMQRESLARRYPPPYWRPDIWPAYPRPIWR